MILRVGRRRRSNEVGSKFRGSHIGYMSEPSGEVLKKTAEPVPCTLVQWF